MHIFRIHGDSSARPGYQMILDIILAPEGLQFNGVFGVTSKNITREMVLEYQIIYKIA